ncbi:hypothetical protein AAG906_003575 [Vitis piasezkii]
MCGGDDHLAWKHLFLPRRADQSVDLPSWVRVEGSLVRFFERSDMDQWDDLDSIPMVDVSRREFEGFRQRSDESISSFISRWQGKIVEIVDRPLQRVTRS